MLAVQLFTVKIRLIVLLTKPSRSPPLIKFAKLTQQALQAIYLAQVRPEVKNR